jgi:hypothetical protein
MQPYAGENIFVSAASPPRPSPRRRDMRGFGAFVLEKRGYKVTPKSGPRMVPGSRVLAIKGAKTIDVAVRTSLSRNLKLNRNADGEWRTIPNVDEVLAVVPAKDNPEKVEVLRFEAATVLKVFNKALAAQKRRGLLTRLEAPVMVPLDDTRPPDSEMPVPGLKAHAKWSAEFPLSDVLDQIPEHERNAGFVDRVKREFATLIGVDVGKVVVEFRVVA